MTLFVPAHAERSFVSPADGTLTLSNVLVPVDHAPDASAAVEFAKRAAEIAGDGKTTISLLHVGAEIVMPRVQAEDGNGGLSPGCAAMASPSRKSSRRRNWLGPISS